MQMSGLSHPDQQKHQLNLLELKRINKMTRLAHPEHVFNNIIVLAKARFKPETSSASGIDVHHLTTVLPLSMEYVTLFWDDKSTPLSLSFSTYVGLA